MAEPNAPGLDGLRVFSWRASRSPYHYLRQASGGYLGELQRISAETVARIAAK